jgi:hypothetical protein
LAPNSERVRRGRPQKFGRPSRVVALTLPEDVVQGLGRLNRDIAWAIVNLFETRSPNGKSRPNGVSEPDSELVAADERRSLIVVNRDVFRRLPGVNIIPLRGNRAFLALDAGRGVSDLELTVVDRLDDPAIGKREREALTKLRTQLKTWRRDPHMRFDARSIIVVERKGQRRAYR